MQLYLYSDNTRFARISVGAPWYLQSSAGASAGSGASYYCDASEITCRTIYSPGLVWVVTDDPDAPARNVRIEEDALGRLGVCAAP